MLEQIIVSTCPNRPYIHRTLASIKVDLPITLVMDSTEDFLPEYEFRKILREGEGVELSKERALRNYCRCLVAAQGLDTLIIEDDVEFCDNWLAGLERCVQYIEKVYSKYVLSIGDHSVPLGGFERGPLQLDYGIVREPAQTLIGDKLHLLAGTQARYFPKTISIRDVLDAMFGGFEELSHCLYDLVLDKYLYSTKTKLFVSQFPLIKHIGKESTLGTPNRIK